MRHRGNILLVNPWIYDFAAYNYWCEPLGLLSLAAVLEKAGWSVTLLDCLEGYLVKTRPDGLGKFQKVNIPKPPCFQRIPRHYGRYGMPMEDFFNRLAGIEAPGAILITSSMTYWYPGVFTAIRLLKRQWSHVPVILGGTYATLCPEHASRFSGADWVVCGEAETCISGIIDRAANPSRSPIGLSDVQAGEVIHIKNTELPELSQLPMAAHELRWFFQDRPAAYIGLETSRGCPCRCSYCASNRLHPVYRRRPIEAVVEEILYYHRSYGIGHIAFYDDALLADRDEHFNPLMEQILRIKGPFAFHTPNGLHVREIDREVARKLFQAGFQTIRLGLETTDPDRQKQTGGKVTNDEFKEAVSCLKETGFQAQQVAAYVMIGWPDQREGEITEAIEFVHSLGIQVRLAEFTPIPHTREGKVLAPYGGFEQEDDPLLHNNTHYTMTTFFNSLQAVDRLKQRAREANRRLLA